MPDDTTDDPWRLVADLRRQLTACGAELTQRTVERDEALAQQAASAEILQIINGSPGDLTQVFDAILERAMSLCGAAFGFLPTYDGEFFRAAAHRGLPPELADLMGRPFAPRGLMAQTLAGDASVQVAGSVTPRAILAYWRGWQHGI